MAINGEVLRLASELRITIADIVDTETRALVRAWAKAWDLMVAEWEAAALDVAASETTFVYMSQLLRLQRAVNALHAAQTQIVKLTDRAQVSITDAAGQVVDLTSQLEARQIAAQMPRTAGTKAELAARFDLVDPEALAAIVERTTKQITALSFPLSIDATDAMVRALLRSIPEGMSPREAARLMIADAERGFNGGLTRALTIARTEILDAYRTAARVHHDANADVLQGWMWQASLDDRVCPSCLAQSGTVHELSEPGPEDHQNGRCARVPVTRPWAELGFAVKEPPPLVQSGEEWFNAQPEATQLAIMGPGRLDALQSGRATFDQLSTRVRTPGWRASLVATPVGAL